MSHTQTLLTVDWDEDAKHPAIRRIQIHDGEVRVADYVDGDYAAFIVRACNAHEAMAHALDDFMELCPCVNDADPIAPALVAACIQARVALKLARGE